MSRKWLKTSEYMPKIDENTRISKSVLVVCHDFGQKPVVAVAYAWLPFDRGEPAWYLDNNFYGISGPPMQIAQQVTHFMHISPLPQV